MFDSSLPVLIFCFTLLSFLEYQMPLNLTNAVQTAQQLLAYTAEAPNFSDKVDVIFVAEMIEKIGKFAEKYKEVSQIKSSHIGE